MTPRRAASRVFAATCAFAVACVWGAVLVTAPHAQAATAYRYWTYWYGKGSGWELGRTGPPTALPDGAVIGWRFAISPDSSSSTPPRAAAAFDAICGGTTGSTGKVRVAVVLDYGIAADAPAGESPPRATPVSYCAVLNAGSNQNGYYATQSAGHTIRVDASGLVCGIDGYPKTECGDAVTAPATTPSATAVPTPTVGSTRPPAPPASAAPAKTSGPSGTTAAQPAQPATGATPPATSTAVPVTPDRSSTSTAPSTDTSNASAAADPASHGSGGRLPVGLIGGGVLVAALAVAATVRTRRR